MRIVIETTGDQDALLRKHARRVLRASGDQGDIEPGEVRVLLQSRLAEHLRTVVVALAVETETELSNERRRTVLDEIDGVFPQG